MNINNPTTFSAPNLTLTTSNSSGTSGALRADDSILIYDTTLPDAITYGQSGSAGSQATAARRDHAHAMAASDTVSAATQAEMEAGTSTTVYASPGTTQDHEGVSKGWISFNGSGTVATDQGFNIGGLADNGTGIYTITWDVDFAEDAYAFAGGASEQRNVGVNGASKLVGSIQIVTTNAAGTRGDDTEISIICTGEAQV